MEKISPVSSEAREGRATDVAFEREAGPPRRGEKNDDRDTSEDLVRELKNSVRNAIVDGHAMGFEQWKVELAEIASLAADIDVSLRRARESVAGLFDSVDEVASRAFDAERSLRDAQDRISAFKST